MGTVYLTTKDNPYDPKKDYLSWHNYDMERGYYSAEYLNRVYEKNLESKYKNNKVDFLDIDEQVLEDSIDEIIEINNLISNSVENESEKPIEYVKLVVNE